MPADANRKVLACPAASYTPDEITASTSQQTSFDGGGYVSACLPSSSLHDSPTRDGGRIPRLVVME